MMDLHTHSLHSDGTCTPREIIKLAKKKEISLCAITDHDCLDGVQEAVEAGKKYDIGVLAGLEMDIEYPVEMHLLAYGFDLQHLQLREIMHRQEKLRFERNQKILDRLNSLGYPVQIHRDERGKLISKTHIAYALVQAGYVSELSEAFHHFLGPRGCAHIQLKRVTAEEYIDLIHQAGGICVLAHPGQMKKHALQAIEELVPIGLDGIEVYYSMHTAREMSMFREIAVGHNLMITAGSDFHGAHRKEAQFGEIAALAALDPLIQETEQHLLKWVQY